MANIKGAVVVNKERCKGCELCVVACPCQVLALQPTEVNDKGYHYAFMQNPDAGNGCEICGVEAPAGGRQFNKVNY